MNTKELNFAYKLRHALNESAEQLPGATLDRLAGARRTALSRQKKSSRLRLHAPQAALAGSAGQIGGWFGSHLPWLARAGIAVPLIVVALGLTGMYRYEQQRHLHDTAEIDAAVLADELPLSAYLDHGFNAYLAKRGE
jgi:hypothetical protein